MSTGRFWPGAVAVEGRICVFGGYMSIGTEGLDEGEALDTAEELDLATGVLKPLPQMPHKIGECFAFLLSGVESSP